VKNNAQFVKDRNISVVAVSLLSTREGDERVRRALHRVKGVDVDFRACEIIENRYYAFGSNNNIWSSAEEAEHGRSSLAILTCPTQDEGLYHALADARWTKEAWAFLATLHPAGAMRRITGRKNLGQAGAGPPAALSPLKTNP
jgi:hypothetical protein